MDEFHVPSSFFLERTWSQTNRDMVKTNRVKTGSRLMDPHPDVYSTFFAASKMVFSLLFWT